MKNIKEIIPAVNYNSIEIFENINKANELNIKIQEFANCVEQFSKERQDILENLNNINTFKAILNKFETHYLCVLYTISKSTNCYKFHIFDFLPIYEDNYSIENYVKNHSKFSFKPLIEYELTGEVSNFNVSNNKLIVKHILRKISHSIISMDLFNILHILSKNEGYFINKMEFNKNYELVK